MYLNLQNELVAHVRATLKRLYDVELGDIAVSQPPNVELGEYAFTFAFELAKKLRKAPKKWSRRSEACRGSLDLRWRVRGTSLRSLIARSLLLSS